MNIFENYLLQINKLISSNKQILKLKNLDGLKTINLEIPPEHINYDLSTNVSLILAKTNRKLNTKISLYSSAMLTMFMALLSCSFTVFTVQDGSRIGICTITVFLKNRFDEEVWPTEILKLLAS